MSTVLLGVLMDGAVLCALAGTIYYTMRLSKSLNNFRSNRDELKGLIVDLSKNIDKAESAMQALRKTSNTAADDLEGVLHDAKKMAEELRFINETSDGLAGRLERLAKTNREIVEKMPAEETSFVRDDYVREEIAEPAYRPSSAANVEAPSFFIQDREFQAGAEIVGEHDEEEFSSQAERDLYQALQKNQRKSG